MKKYNSWLEVYEIAKRECELISYKKEHGEHIVLFVYMGIEFRVVEYHSSFDMRTKKKDFIGCKIFNYISDRVNSKNWNSNGRHKHSNLLRPLLDSMLTQYQKSKNNIELEIASRDEICMNAQISVDKLKLDIAKLDIESLKEFHSDMDRAKLILNELTGIMRKHEHSYTNILRTLNIQPLYEYNNYIDSIKEKLK